MATRTAPRTEVFFMDGSGRRWQIFEYSVMGGRRLVRSVGAGGADYRAFVPMDHPGGGKPRLYRFWKDGPTGGRSLEPVVLERQLEEAEEIEARVKRAG
jgi:hypothetical protein